MQQLRGTSLGCRPQVARGTRTGPWAAQATTSAPVSHAPSSQSPLLKSIQFINPIWASVENEQQFFAILKVKS